MNHNEGTKKRFKTIAYWMTTILGPASFVIGGFLSLTQNPEAVNAFASLGYPSYLLYILGTWKVLGAIVTVIPGCPRLKEWAYAGFFFELTGAALSNAFAHHGLLDIFSPLIFLALVMSSWALRPPSRRLRSDGS